MENVNSPTVESDESDKCHRCSRIFDKSDETYSIECGDCRRWLHYYCADLSPIQLLSYAQSRKKFTCNKCVLKRYPNKKEWLAEATAAINKHKALLEKQGCLPKSALATQTLQSSPTNNEITRSVSLNSLTSLTGLGLIKSPSYALAVRNQSTSLGVGLGQETPNKSTRENNPNAKISQPRPNSEIKATPKQPVLSLGLGSTPTDLSLPPPNRDNRPITTTIASLSQETPRPHRPSSTQATPTPTPRTTPTPPVNPAPPQQPNNPLVKSINHRPSQQTTRTAQQVSKNSQYTTITVCPHYKQGNCQYGPAGRQCKYRHPRPCRKLIEHGPNSPLGCKRGKECPHYHPKLCPNSLRMWECLNEECNLPHIKGTRRHTYKWANQAPNRQSQQNRYNPPNTHYAKYSNRLEAQTHLNNNVSKFPNIPRETARQMPPNAEPYPPIYSRNETHPQSENSQAFLGYMRRMETTLESLTKTVEAQGYMISGHIMGKHLRQDNLLSPMPPPWADRIRSH